MYIQSQKENVFIPPTLEVIAEMTVWFEYD